MSSTEQNYKQPTVVRYSQSVATGVENQRFSRYAIGYVVRGKKYIYNGDSRYEIKRGDIFCLSIGSHYIEDIPEADKPSEQIIFYLTSDMLSQTISLLNQSFGMILDEGSVKDYSDYPVISNASWDSIKIFFNSISQYTGIGFFNEDDVNERIWVTQLLYLLLSRHDSIIRDYLLSKSYMMSESFERIVYNSIFDDISIDSLAQKSNMSATSFKKEFRRVFNESPHRWFIRQRLMRARHLLISSNNSIVEIGEECGFSNTSHFIKLFKSEFEVTPAVYRQMSRKSSEELSMNGNGKSL